MSSLNLEQKKQSIIMGAMISSAGIFIAKVIGLLYAIPFNDILHSAVNIEYYGMTQQLYAYLLNVTQAGFPMAIATLVSRYYAKDDYRSALFVKKVSSQLMISLGLLVMLLLIFFSLPIANGFYAGAGSAYVFHYALIGSSFALFFVPILSSMRGFYQGLKKMDIYSSSQVLEQMTNACFVLVASSIAIYIFNADRIWAVYLGVFSTSVAAIVAMIFLKLYDRKAMKAFKQAARQQKAQENISRRVILKELVKVSIPYMLIALLGYSDSIINMFILPNGLAAHGYAKEEISLISSTVNYSVLKLMSIPMVLAPGFSSAIAPHMESAIVKKDTRLVKKSIHDVINVVLFIAIPISLCLAIFAKPLIIVLFPPEFPENVAQCASILSWFAIVAFLNTVSPVVTNTLCACHLRKKATINIGIQVVIKFALTFMALKLFGYQGMVFTTMISMLVSIGIGIYDLTKKYQLKWIYTIRKIVIILIASLVMFIVARIFFMFGFEGDPSGSRMMNFVKLAISGGVSVIAYFIVTYFCHLPQTILNFDIKKIMNKLTHRG